MLVATRNECVASATRPRNGDRIPQTGQSQRRAGTLPARPVFTSDPLPIYLQDHLAGATAGRELARRAQRSNEGTPLGRVLERLCTEIDEDRDALVEVMDRLGVSADRLKVAAGWVGEKAGRLKLNGRLVGYSPLSRVLELEGLIMAAEGKLCAWRGLEELAAEDDRLEAGRLTELARRAERQLEELREHDRLAARQALVTERAS